LPGRQGRAGIQRYGAGGTLVGDAQQSGGPGKPKGGLAERPAGELCAETQPGLEAGSQAHK